MKKILISNISHRKAFDVIAVISNKFPEIGLILGDEEISNFSVAKMKLVYKGDYVLLRTEEYEDFCADIKNISEKYRDDEIIFFPVEEQPTKFFLQFIQSGELNFKYLLPNIDSFNLLRDKYELNKYCLNNNVSAPRLFDSSELRDLKDTDFPIILKPKLGSGSKGIMRLYSKKDITQNALNALAEQQYVIQELLPNGRDVKGAFFLVKDGQVVSSYTHERIRTSPPEGGVTVLSKISNNSDILEVGAKLLKLVNWNGLVMLEYLYDDMEGAYKIIEANPRLWGSILLSEFSGADLLSNYVKICLDLPVLTPVISQDVYIRWFFPVDFLNYLKSMGRIKGFWNFKNTCFINYTYASFSSSFFYNLFSIFKLKNLKRFFAR